MFCKNVFTVFHCKKHYKEAANYRYPIAKLDAHMIAHWSSDKSALGEPITI